MSSLDAYLAAQDAEAEQPYKPPHTRVNTAFAGVMMERQRQAQREQQQQQGNENDAPTNNASGGPRASPSSKAGYQAVKSRMLSRSNQLATTVAGARRASASNVAAPKPLLVKSAAGGFVRRPVSAAATALSPHARRAAMNAGMAREELESLHPPAALPTRSPLKAVNYQPTAAATAIMLARQTSGAAPAPPAASSSSSNAHCQQQLHAHVYFASPPAGAQPLENGNSGGWFSPARTASGHFIPAGSDHVPWRPSLSAADHSMLFNAADASPPPPAPTAHHADRARFQADVEPTVFSPPRDSSAAARRFSSPAAAASNNVTLFHSPLSASWIQSLRARTARIMNLASTNATASGNSPPFDPRANAVAQAHSPFDPLVGPARASVAAEGCMHDRAGKQNLIFSPATLKDANRIRFAGMGVGAPTFSLHSPSVMARHRAEVAAANRVPLASAAAPSSQAAQSVCSSQRQRLLDEYHQSLAGMQRPVEQPHQHQPQQQQQSIHLSPIQQQPQPPPARAHSVATSPMVFSSPVAARTSPVPPMQQSQLQQQHSSPLAARLSQGHRHGHAHGDDGECDGCSHGHHHHALASRHPARRDVQTSPMASMRNRMTSPMTSRQQPQSASLFASPLRASSARASPSRPAASAVPSNASSVSSFALPPSQSQPQQPLSLADRINSNLASLKQLNSRANYIAVRSPVPAPLSADNTIPLAHEAHRNVLERIDSIISLTKQPVEPPPPPPPATTFFPDQQQQQQAGGHVGASFASYLSMPTPSALSVVGGGGGEEKFPEHASAGAEPLLHDISELTHSYMEDSRGDALPAMDRSIHAAPSSSSSAAASKEAEDRKRFQIWQQRMWSQQQQNQAVHSAPPVAYPAQQQQQQFQPEPQHHSDDISQALAHSLRNIQSLRSSLANSRQMPQQLQQPQQEQFASTVPIYQQYAAPSHPQPQFAHSATVAATSASAPFATVQYHPDPSVSSGLNFEFHPSAPGSDYTTSICVGAALMPSIMPVHMPPSATIGWTMPRLKATDKHAEASTWKIEPMQQQQQRRPSIATTIPEGLSPPRESTSIASSRAITPPSPSLAVAPLVQPTVATQPPPHLPRARVVPFTPIAASNIFAEAFSSMPFHQTPAGGAVASKMRFTMQQSPVQIEQQHLQQRHNADMLSTLNGK